MWVSEYWFLNPTNAITITLKVKVKLQYRDTCANIPSCCNTVFRISPNPHIKSRKNCIRYCIIDAICLLVMDYWRLNANSPHIRCIPTCWRTRRLRACRQEAGCWEAGCLLGWACCRRSWLWGTVTLVQCTRASQSAITHEHLRHISLSQSYCNLTYFMV